MSERLRDRMVICEYFRTRRDGVKLCCSYSDRGLYLIQNETGIKYSETIDVEGAPYSYSESDMPIENADGDAAENRETAF